MKKKIDSAEKDVEAVLEIINPETSLRDLIKYLSKKIFSNSSSKNSQKILSILLSSENVQALRDITKKAYLENFTAEEIKAMLKFYSSKNGRSIASKTSKVAIILSEATKEWTNTVLDNSKEQIEQLLQEQMREDSQRKVVDSDILSKKLNFAMKYAAERGWDLIDLTEEQIKEIHDQEGWKNAELH